MLSNGTLLQQRYRIIRLLARGGMGAVYEAEAVHLGNAPVAVKQTFYSERQRILREQFEREAAMMARLRHPALPKVSDHFVEGGEQFLVMEFIPGADLFALLNERRRPFDCAHVTAWAETLLDALDYIHTQQPPIIHRDIKPHNLKLTPLGELFLIDFGLAKKASASTHSSASLHAYTLSYAPPEQINDAGTDARSDLYSLGATLYHLLVGEPPVNAKVREEVVQYRAPDPLRLPHQVNPNIPPALSVLIARAMALDRESRYGSAAEMLQALREGSVSTSPTTPGEPSHWRSQTQEGGGAQSRPQASETADKSPPVAPSREQFHTEVAEKPNTVYVQLSHPDAYRVSPPKAIIIGPLIALPIIVTLAYLSFTGGYPGANKTGEGNVPSEAKAVRRPVKLPTSVAPAGSVGNFDFETVTLDDKGYVISRQKKQARHFGEDLGDGVVLELVEIPGGEAMIGSSEKETGREPYEGAQRKVKLQSFWIGKYEVTQEQWREVAKLPIVKSPLNPDPSSYSNERNKTPVDQVSWDDAVEFCERLSRKTGRSYRLPNEAEWEYAARAGTITRFAFGSTITAAVANCFHQDILTVGKLGVANTFGLFDMHGNILEWCQDDLRNDLQGWPAEGALLKKGDGRFRPLRGGSSLSTGMELGIEFCRSAMRFRARAETRRQRFGLRVVISEAPR
jgi:formylglycine-generating enzyme required for sulfatase activity/serine/threonine protein kinase